MASCDVWACFKSWTTNDAASMLAEQNAAKMTAVYEAHVVESQKRLALEQVRARALVGSLKAARVAKNEVAVAAATAAAKQGAARVVEARARCTKFGNMADSFRHAREQMEEARRLQDTVEAMRTVKKHMRSLNLDGLADAAGNVADATGDADMQLYEIGSALVGGGGREMPGVSEAELEAALLELEEECGEPPTPVYTHMRPPVPHAAPGHADVPSVLSSLAAYDAALAAGTRNAVGVPAG